MLYVLYVNISILQIFAPLNIENVLSWSFKYVIECHYLWEITLVFVRMACTHHVPDLCLQFPWVKPKINITSQKHVCAFLFTDCGHHSLTIKSFLRGSISTFFSFLEFHSTSISTATKSSRSRRQYATFLCSFFFVSIFHLQNLLIITQVILAFWLETSQLTSHYWNPHIRSILWSILLA